MATNNNGLVLGDIAALYVENVRLAHITSVSISFQNELREVVGDSSVRQYIYSRDSWNASADGLCSFADGYNLDFLLSLLDNYQVITMKMPTNSAGTEYLQGQVLLESCDIKSDAGGDVVRMSLSFKGSGALSRNIISYQIEGSTPKADPDDAACGKQFTETYYIENLNNEYPYLVVGSQIWLDSAHTIKLTGFSGSHVGIKYQQGKAYTIDANGVVTAVISTTCTNLNN